MSDQDSSQDKSEQPTPKKLDKAREEGQTPRSKELTTTGLLLGGSIGLWVFGSMMIGVLADIMTYSFTLDREEIFDVNRMTVLFTRGMSDGVVSMLPLFGVLLVASIAGPIALGGWLISSKAMEPKFSRMNPLEGLKKMFSVKSLMELAKALAKVLVILTVAIVFIVKFQPDFLALANQALEPALSRSLHLSILAAVIISAATVLIAMVDIPFQIWDHTKKLKMSKQDIKDEMKDSEGKPEVKSRIRQLQHEMSQRRMMSAVPEADVVITNPTHFSVALKYDPDNMQTPILLAKGVDLVAFKIREIAQAHKIDVIQSPQLARSIYYSTEIDQEIPSGLYLAVAQVLAYIFQLRHYRRGQGDKPTYPKNVRVPPDLRK